MTLTGQWLDKTDKIWIIQVFLPEGYLERASDTDREAAVKDYMKIVGKEMKEICDEVVVGLCV